MEPEMKKFLRNLKMKNNGNEVLAIEVAKDFWESPDGQKAIKESRNVRTV